MDIELYLEQTTKERWELITGLVDAFKNSELKTILPTVPMVQDLNETEAQKLVDYFFEIHPTLKEWKEL